MALSPAATSRREANRPVGARWQLIITAIAAILAATPFINISTLRAAWQPVIHLVYQNPSDVR